jgi:hypothetical protein
MRGVHRHHAFNFLDLFSWYQNSSCGSETTPVRHSSLITVRNLAEAFDPESLNRHKSCFPLCKKCGQIRLKTTEEPEPSNCLEIL